MGGKKYSSRLSSPGSEGVRLRLLGFVLVVRTSIDLELAKLGSPKAGVRDHPADSALDEQLGPTGPDLAGSFDLLPSDVSGVTGVDFLGLLVPTELNLLGVHDDDMVTSVDMRGEDGLVLATQEFGSLHSHLAEDLVGGVNDVPLAFDIGSFGRKGLH